MGLLGGEMGLEKYTNPQKINTLLWSFIFKLLNPGGTIFKTKYCIYLSWSEGKETKEWRSPVCLLLCEKNSSGKKSKIKVMLGFVLFCFANNFLGIFLFCCLGILPFACLQDFFFLKSEPGGISLGRCFHVKRETPICKKQFKGCKENKGRFVTLNYFVLMIKIKIQDS